MAGFTPHPSWQYNAADNTYTAPDGRKFNEAGQLLDTQGRVRAEVDANRLSKTEGLVALGNQGTKYELTKADSGILETFPSPFKNAKGAVGVIQLPQAKDEFTSLCPLTGQPDFANIYVEYTPRDKCLESKSWKLYLFSFRQHADFHESCVVKIYNDLLEALDPIYLHVKGNFTPRGGIAIWPVLEYRAEDARG